MGELAFVLGDTYTIACYCYHKECGIPIVMSHAIEKRLRKNHEWWYCLNGHAQHFTKETEEEKLRKLLEKERAWRDGEHAETERQRERANAAERREAAQKGVVTRLKNRAAAGLCPCCNRSFQNLKRHMEIKHPEQVKAAGRDV